METKYPTLRRPKRKLCYLTNKESVTKQWQGTLTLGDVDKMFDDLDSCSEDDLFAPSLTLQTSDCETNQSEREASPVPQEAPLTKKPPICQMGPKGDVLLPATVSPSPNLDIDLDIPFDVHGPVKTSSPIKDNAVVESLEEEGNEKKQVEPPIFFDCEDDIKEDDKTQKPQSDGHVKEESDDCELVSPPSAITFSKSMMSSHKNKLQGSCKESQPVREKTHKKTQTPVMEGKRKTARQESESEPAAPEKRSKSVHGQPPAEMSTRVGKDMTAFLQKLRDARQPKPACFRKSLSPVKVPNPPEQEDDFLILEDDTPLCFSIPSKTATSKRQQQSRTSSTDKDSSTDKETKDSALETAQKEEEPEKASVKLRVQPVNQKMKKKKKGKEKNEVSGPGNDEDDLASPEDPPAGDMVEPEQPNKRKQQRLKKIPSKESDKAKEEPKDTVSRKPDEEEPTQKVEKKSQKSSEMKSSKLSEDGKEKAKTGKAKSLKGTRKARQGPGDIKEAVYDVAVKEQSREQKNKKHADGRDLGSLSDKEMMNSDAQTAKDLADGKAKQNTLSVVSEGSLSEESQILGKRKRKQTGQWWLSCTQSAEETKATDNQPTLKKSKQHNKEPSATEPSPVKAKKDRPLKKRNQKQPAPSSSQSTTLAKEKKPKQNKKGGASREKTKAADEVFNTIEAEQFEEQRQEEEVPDHDLDPGHSSPLVLAHRDLSLNPGEQLFQRVYNHVSGTPGRLSPRRPLEKHRAAERERRSRKPPGNWWTVNDMSEDVGSASSQPQQLNPKEPKSRKDRKKQSRSPRLGTPKNGNMLVSSKPLGGAHVSPLKVKPLSAPKTVKRSLAMFKEIFTSGAETPTVLSSRDKGQNNTHNVNAPPAEEVTVTDCYTVSKSDKEILSLDAGEFRGSQNSSINHNVPQDNKCRPENMLKDVRSGPSSMIELAEYEDSDSCLPSSRVHAALSVSDLCAPPLKPLTLQPKDKANLTEWFRTLWSTTVNDGTDITPDQFDWYFYQGRAIGVLADLNCGSICNGKILLGSYMKKPLLVDHSATTVFNLLTSSVNVTINGMKSHFNPGQSFMVQCGHAYSIQNVTAQPAVLYFTRISAESSD